jgi:hypothetical protein
MRVHDVDDFMRAAPAQRDASAAMAGVGRLVELDVGMRGFLLREDEATACFGRCAAL